MNFPKHMFSVGIVNRWTPLANATCGSPSLYAMVFRLPVDFGERMLNCDQPERSTKT